MTSVSDLLNIEQEWKAKEWNHKNTKKVNWSKKNYDSEIIFE